jgi:hypothetical protein
MSSRVTLLILSDIHYASDAEKARGDFELAAVDRPLVRLAIHAFRHYIWMRRPQSHNRVLDRFLDAAGQPDLVIANGDYSCDSRFIGVSDDAACASVRECLGKLRGRFGDKFIANLGDHELGKKSLSGGKGGMRLASWHRAQNELALPTFWQLTHDRYVLIGVVSSLVALPVFAPDALPEELPEWRRLRERHLAEIRRAFAALRSDQRVMLFCHDPTALPYLWREDAVRARLGQVERTFIGHLHSELVWWKSRLLSGLPVISFLGNAVRRMSTGLNQARHWKPFKVRLCPALAGIELLKDGGDLEIQWSRDDGAPLCCQRRRLARGD